MEIVSGNAVEAVYLGISQQIIDGSMLPGTVLTELEVAQQFDVSRTPVRAALAKLTADGLLSARGSRQLQVSILSPEEIHAIYDLRFALEPEAMRLAAERGNPETFAALAEQLRRASALISADLPASTAFYEIHEKFDVEVWQAMQSPFLEKALTQLQLHLRRIRRLSKASPERLVRANEETARVAAAIAAKDPTLAAAAMRVHLSASLETSLRLVEERKIQQESRIRA